MRRLPIKRTAKQNLIIKSVEDYFGEANPEERKSVVKIALWLMKRKRRLPELTEEEKEAISVIQANLSDKTYRFSFNGVK